MTKKVKEQLELRDTAWKVYMNRRTDAAYEVYGVQRNRSVHVQRKAKIAYETCPAQRAATNPNQFFGHIRTNKGLKNQVTTLKGVDGIRVTDPSSQANICAETIHRTFRPTSELMTLLSSKTRNRCL